MKKNKLLTLLLVLGLAPSWNAWANAAKPGKGPGRASKRTSHAVTARKTKKDAKPEQARALRPVTLDWRDGQPVKSGAEFAELNLSSRTARLMYEHGRYYKRIIEGLMGRKSTEAATFEENLSSAALVSDLDPGVRDSFFEFHPLRGASRERMLEVLGHVQESLRLAEGLYDHESLRGSSLPDDLSFLADIERRLFGDFKLRTSRKPSIPAEPEFNRTTYTTLLRTPGVTLRSLIYGRIVELNKHGKTIELDTGSGSSEAFYLPALDRVAVMAYGPLLVFDASSGKQLIRGWPTEAKDPSKKIIIHGARTLPGGKKILTNVGNREMRVFDAEKLEFGPAVPVVEDNQKVQVWQMEVAPDGKSVLTTASDGAVKVWNIGSDVLTESHRFKIEGGRGASVAAYSPDSRLVAFQVEGKGRPMDFARAGEDFESKPGFVEIYDVRAGRLLKSFGVDHMIQSMSYSPSGKYLILSHIQRMTVVSAETGEKVYEFAPPGVGVRVNQLELSPARDRAILTYRSNNLEKVLDPEAKGNVAPYLLYQEPISFEQLKRDGSLPADF